jgi:hypothetical protein
MSILAGVGAIAAGLWLVGAVGHLILFEQINDWPGALRWFVIGVGSALAWPLISLWAIWIAVFDPIH